MAARIQQRFKRFRLLVDSVRAWRRAQAAHREELRREDQWRQTINARRKVIATYLATHQIRKLQIGAGGNALTGWLNADLEPSSDDVIYIDATEAFPFDDHVFDYVFSEHMIEHISYRDGLFMLGEVFRVLKPGGTLRIATPDVEKIVALLSAPRSAAQEKYLEWHSVRHMGLYSAETSPLQQRRSEWAIDHTHIRRFFPNPAQDSACFVVNNLFRSYGHRFLYNVQTLRAALESEGFVDVVSCAPGESTDAALQGIESHGNLIGEDMNQFETMILEGTRPIVSRS